MENLSTNNNKNTFSSISNLDKQDSVISDSFLCYKEKLNDKDIKVIFHSFIYSLTYLFYKEIALLTQKKKKSPTDIFYLKEYLRSVEFMNRLFDTIPPELSQTLLLQLKYQSVNEHQSILNYGSIYH